MNNNGFIANLLSQVDSITNQFVFQGYQNLAAAFTPAITALIVLSVIILGYASLQGYVAISLREVSKRILTIGFILVFALDWGNFSSYIYNVFTQVPNEIASELLPTLQNNSVTDATSVNVSLQKALNDGFYFVKATWEQGSTSNVLPFLSSICMAGLLITWIGFALIELIVAKFGLAIYLVLAPVIIPLFLFQYTKNLIFEGWLKHLVIFSFIPIFITAAITLGLTLLQLISTDTQQAVTAHTLNLMSVVTYLIYSFICIGLIKKATWMASAIAHGFTTSASHYLDNTAALMKGQLVKSFSNKPANLPTYRG